MLFLPVSNLLNTGWKMATLQMIQSEPVSVRNAKLLPFEANLPAASGWNITNAIFLCVLSVCFLTVFSSSLYDTLLV